MDDCFHAMLLTGGDLDCKCRHVAGLDTDHLGPFPVPQIGHGPRLLHPRIPYDRRKGVFFGNEKAPVKGLVFHLDHIASIQVNPIGLRPNDERTGPKFSLFESVLSR